ncbi:MAG: MaoC family dehydratase [Actinomycetota bacterium]|nr:MaoC family dehydratase [Actinomycetota bacterium]
MRVFDGVDELRAAKGEELEPTDWLTIDQDRVNQFADATDDHQWIHVDLEKAKSGPFGTTIAHGFLTLSLLPELIARTYKVDGVRMGINYGLNKVRFINPLPVGSRIRGKAQITDVTDVAGGVQITTTVTVEIEGAEKPALVAEWLTRQHV